MVEQLRAASHVDYEAIMAVKSPVLDALHVGGRALEIGAPAEEVRRRQASPPGATIDSKTDQINRAILRDRCDEAIRILEGLRPEDVAAVYRIDSKVERVQEFSGGRDLAPTAYAIRAKGMTTLNDAIVEAAKTLADRYFMETAVRLHRLGEKAPYTGLKPAGTDFGPAIGAARGQDVTIHRGDAMPEWREAPSAASGMIRSKTFG